MLVKCEILLMKCWENHFKNKCNYYFGNHSEAKEEIPSHPPNEFVATSSGNKIHMTTIPLAGRI